jgi:hypothetical protein
VVVGQGGERNSVNTRSETTLTLDNEELSGE